jgi:uncharacterized membrane protein
MAERKSETEKDTLLTELPLDRLKEEAQGLVQAVGERGWARATQSVDGLMDRLDGIASGDLKAKVVKNAAEGDSTVKAGAKAVASKVKDKVGDALPGGNGGNGGGGSGSNDSGKKIKVTNIVESVDVPVSREVAYQQWTQFEEFPSFMKKVENVKQEDDEVVTWQAQIFWSHRTWKATIVDQVPNERIVWKSEGDKGHVDGAITFHELAPDLTRVLATLEYHPKGLFEHTANLWRAQGRRVRVELKHYRRHVATHTLLNQDELEGWQGEIHDEQVTSDGSPARKQAQKRSSSRSSTAKKTSSSRGSTSGGSTQRSAAKKTTAKKSAAKKAPAKRSAAKKAPAKKSATKKTAAKKSTAKKSSSSSSRRSGSRT